MRANLNNDDDDEACCLTSLSTLLSKRRKIIMKDCTAMKRHSLKPFAGLEPATS